VDGLVSANGANGLNERSGGGSGGSIWLSAQSYAGNGSLSANGGAGEPALGGGGGGGRIALWHATSLFVGNISARGGNGYVRGGAGTIYSRATSRNAGQVVVDNGGKTGGSTLLTASPSELFDVTVQPGGIVSIPLSPIGNLVLASNAWIISSNITFTLTINSNATIHAGGGIIADGRGFAAGQGSGAGKFASTPAGYVGGGGGYGGYGAAGGAPAGYSAWGGATYGVAPAPMDPGSGGGNLMPYALGGAGGGGLRLTVTGMLLLDGRISADGTPGLTQGGGGGSGGSVWLTVGTLAGSGTISVNGGSGNGVGLGGGGGGGGGRVSVLYNMNLFFGAMSARGGDGAAWGGAGTIYTKANQQSLGLVVADNGGHLGTNTTFGFGSIPTVDLTVRNGAVLSPPGSQPFGTLLVGPNGWMIVSNQALTVAANATVQALF
jgi:hypothetical protein